MRYGHLNAYGSFLLLGDRIERSERESANCLLRASRAYLWRHPSRSMVVSQDTRLESLRKVLVAANRAIAHINPTDVDHSVDADVLIPAIDLVESLVQTHIYGANGLRLLDAMNHPNNRV